ncbi:MULTISPECIES: helix-turn-helix transcriptional regulator [unclassified Micromonospora]|uniref:helix-turn-helix domain-containing protein n=1 Tax=unclassified Micromonospora TaxID=2617518 RepID=UPI0033241A72
MARTDYIGLRVARWRDIAGLTQLELADRVGYSREYISMIENGSRIVTKRSLLIALATALGVSVNDLTGQPDRPRSRDELAVYSAVPNLRGALDDEPDTLHPLHVDQLTAGVDQAMRARMMCDYPALARILPSLIADTRRLADSDNPAGLALFVRAAVCAALTIKPFGYVDLSARLSERAELAARLLDRPVELAAARFAAAQTALSSGTSGGQRRSLHTAATAAAQLGDSGGDDHLSWYGMLHLHAALSAASLGRTTDVATHLAEAEATATRTTSDPWRMEWSPANVAVWRVGVAVENGEPERAPEYARRVDRTQLRTANRLARLHIDAGRGHYAAGEPEQAVRRFLAADEVSGPELRSRTTVREIVAQLVRDARRGGSDELRDLAVRMGVDPLDPDHHQV